MVSGASKRGWTTWLTGASDSRVVAIAPMVIDILNMPVNLDYQVKMWKDYSVQIEDYVKLGIPQTSDLGKRKGNYDNGGSIFVQKKINDAEDAFHGNQ